MEGRAGTVERDGMAVPLFWATNTRPSAEREVVWPAPGLELDAGLGAVEG